MATRFLRFCRPDGNESTTTDDRLTSIERYYHGNLGNLLFDQVLAEDLILDSTEFEVDDIDLGDTVVMSLANYVSTAATTGSRPLERAVMREQSRVVIAGLGIQYWSVASAAKIEPHKRATLEVASRMTTSLGVRGYLSERVLRENGIKNVAVIGCPSMSRLPSVASAAQGMGRERGLADLVVSGTPSGYFRDVLGNVFEFGRRHDARFVVQTEPYLGRRAHELFDTVSYYAATPQLDPSPIANWLADRATAFWTMDQWMDGLGPGVLHVGTRFHSAVATLLAGGRALLITTDARTREMADYHALPVLSPDDFRPDLPVDELWDMADPSWAYARSVQTYPRFVDFLCENELSLKGGPDAGRTAGAQAVFTIDDIARALAGNARPGIEDLVHRLRPDRDETVQKLLDLHPHLRRGIDAGDADVAAQAMRDLVAMYERTASRP